MADRSRRKSSILKAPKTNQRAPLQDVNTLSQELKCSQDDEMTSHASLRRRVSFAGKNFVKEFCSESEIASVHHALEYEQEWSATTDSSGLVMSDCSNNTQNTAASESVCITQSRFQSSLLKSVTTSDDFNPAEQIMKEFQWKKISQPQVQIPNSVRKNRFSFGDIQVRSLDEDGQNASPEGSQAASEGNKTSQPTQVYNIGCEEINVEVKKNQVGFERSITSQTKTNIQSTQVAISSSSQDVPFSSEKTQIQNVSNSQKFAQNPGEFNSKHPRLLSTPVESSSVVDEVPVSPKLPASMPMPESYRVDETKLDDSGMEFTKPIPSIIECGIQVGLDAVGPMAYVPQGQDIFSKTQGVCQEEKNYIAEVKNNLPTSSEGHVIDDRVTNSTNDMDVSLELTRAVPNVIQVSFQRSTGIENVDPLVSSALPVTSPTSQIDAHISNCQNSDLGSVFIERMQNADTISKSVKNRRFEGDPEQGQFDAPSTEAGSDQTFLMSMSMEFTAALPANIQVFSGGLHKDINQQGSQSLPEGKMLPENIHSDAKDDPLACDMEKSKERCNQTQAFSTSMEFTEVLPSNIYVNLKNAISNEKCVENEAFLIRSKSQLMGTSMEFSRGRGNSIQFGLECGLNGPVNTEEQGNGLNTRNQSPSIYIESSEQLSSTITGLGTRHEEVPNDSQIQATGRRVPHSTQENCEIEQSTAARPLHEDILSFNHTQAMCTSMEFTKPLPSNIYTGFGPDVDLLIPHCRGEAMNTSEDFVVHSTSSNNVESRQDTQNEAQLLGDKLPVPKPLLSVSLENCIPDIRNEPIALENRVQASAGTEMEIQIQQPGMETQVINRVTPPVDSSNDLRRMSVTSVPDPFKSKPRLIFSPSTGNGIESLPMLTKSVNDSGEPIRTGCEEASSIEKSPEPIRTGCEEASSIEKSPEPIRTGCEEASSIEKSSPFVSKKNESICSSSHSNKENEQSFNISPRHLARTERPRSPEPTGIPDPFKSKPCLMASPRLIISEPIPPTNHENDMDMILDFEGTIDTICNKSSTLPPKERLDLLLDVSPPFQDVSSNNTIEISADVTDTCANMLHTTIMNADITLRQMQSPKKLEDVEVVRVCEELEDLQCSPVISTDSNVKSTSTSTSSLNCESHSESCEGGRKVDVTSHIAIRSAKRARDLDSDCESNMTVNKVSKVNANLCSKRACDLDVDFKSNSSEDSIEIRVTKRACRSNANPFGNEAAPVGTDPENILAHSYRLSCSNQNSNANDSATSSNAPSVSLNCDDVIFKNQMRYPQYWKAEKGDIDLWSFKFLCTELELRIHLKSPPHHDGSIEAYNGRFISNVSDATKPIIRWSMDLLMKKICTQEWNSRLQLTDNLMQTLEDLVEVIIPFRKFLVETIKVAGQYNLEFTNDSLSFDITSFKCLLWFKVYLKLDSWEKYSPYHISVRNIIGETRELEVKNLITGVKKDVYFLRNYIRDVNDYVGTLEQF